MFGIIKKLINKKCSGFTMVETIMYIAFISVMIGLFVGFGSQMTDLRAKTAVIQNVEANGSVVVNFLEDYLKRSRQIISPSVGTVSSVLVLDMPDAEENITFSVVDGILYVAKGVSDPVQVTSDAINIKNLSFINTAQIGQKDNVLIDLDVVYRFQSSRAYEYGQQYQTTVTLR